MGGREDRVLPAVKIGYFLSCEEWAPADLVRQAVKAQAAGFEDLWISDHYHPWNDEQGHSPFVWSVIGAIAQATEMHVTTAVTCPTVRIHPAIVAHAAATSAVLLEGRFALGLGSGEALNEHILADRWPETEQRLAFAHVRLIEHQVVAVARGLARKRTVIESEKADHPVRHGPHRIERANGQMTGSEIGPGRAAAQPVGPDADSVQQFRAAAREGTVVQGGLKVCLAEDAERARQTVHELWPNEGLPGELAQILPTPAHFEQASGSGPGSG